jgi:two-component system OmpR family response regulator
MAIRAATFPRLERRAPGPVCAPPRPAAVRRALVAEPDRLTRDLITLRLRRIGWQVEAVTDGSAALAALQARPLQVALLALWLPGLNAFEVLRQAAAAAPRTLILSPFASPELVAEAVRVGASDFILKPIEIGQLAARLERC